MNSCDHTICANLVDILSEIMSNISDPREVVRDFSFLTHVQKKLNVSTSDYIRSYEVKGEIVVRKIKYSL